MNKQITYDDIDAFLEGTLSAEREKEVGKAIDNSKELQDLIEVTLDIDDMLLFDEIRLVKLEPQSNTKPLNRAVSMAGSSADKDISGKNDFRRNASTWEHEEYRQAADRDGRKLAKLKSKKLVENNSDEGHSYWLEIIVGIIVMIIIAAIKSCIR